MKGQSNWADIDDDDEWAPDTITWTDGTKITLPAADEATASPIAQPAIIDKVKKDPILVPKSKSPAPVSSASGSPSIKQGSLASGKVTFSKGPQEKPTLVAKSPAASGPPKNPWAAIPTVDKVSPVAVPALPPQATRYTLRRGPRSHQPPFKRAEIVYRKDHTVAVGALLMLVEEVVIWRPVLEENLTICRRQRDLA